MNISLVKSACIAGVAAILLSGCSDTGSFQGLKPAVKESATDDTAASEMRSEVRKQPKNIGNITVADAAKVTDAELKAAVAKPVKLAERYLGKTTASLGLLDDAGFWLQTPLVQSEAEGRVVYLKTNASVNLRLIPNGAAPGSGSQISIAAMNVLGIPIVDLAELQVYTR